MAYHPILEVGLRVLCRTRPTGAIMAPTVLSIVIPVFNSAPIVGETLDRVLRTCEAEGWTAEVVAVNDGSTDGSADVLRQRAARHPAVRVIDLPRNGGQHAALLAGLRAARGSVVVCLDDDLQHPPEAMPALVRKVEEGHDVVFARFAAPRHAVWRRPGSTLVRAMDRVVFGAPPGLSVSSYRALRRDVVDRVCAYRGTTPYIRGQVLLACASPANVDVEHHPRASGQSGYSPGALVALVLRVLMEWSPLPAIAATATGALLLLVGVTAVAAPRAASLVSVAGASLVVSGLWLVIRRGGIGRP